MTNDSWIWQSPDWPYFQWDEGEVQPRLRDVRLKLGILLGKAAGAGEQNDRRTLDTLLANIIASSAIENETFNVQSVRSSLARRLHIHEDDPHPVSERSEGLALLMLDAIQNAQQPLDWPHLCCWHHWLFSDQGISFNRRPLRVGQLRGDEPMQVVSGRLDRPKVHFEAPPRDRLMAELEAFIRWFNASRADLSQDPLLRAALCHLWFVTLHPFDDGNGRITRALTDMALAQADSQSIQLYAMSIAILDRRQDYYRILEQTQRGDVEITPWLLWFLDNVPVPGFVGCHNHHLNFSLTQPHPLGDLIS